MVSFVMVEWHSFRTEQRLMLENLLLRTDKHKKENHILNDINIETIQIVN